MFLEDIASALKAETRLAPDKKKEFELMLLTKLTRIGTDLHIC